MFVFSYCFVFNVCVQASTQTDAMRVPVSRRRQMKNKSVLCRPFTMDQEVMCQLLTPTTDSEGNYKTNLLNKFLYFAFTNPHSHRTAAQQGLGEHVQAELHTVKERSHNRYLLVT